MKRFVILFYLHYKNKHTFMNHIKIDINLGCTMEYNICIPYFANDRGISRIVTYSSTDILCHFCKFAIYTW